MKQRATFSLASVARGVLLCAISVFTTVAAAAELPQGLSRFNPAGLPRNWAYEGTAFYALRAGAGASTIPIIRMHHPTQGFLYASSDAEAAAAERIGFHREGTAFFAPAKEGIPVLRFHNPRTGSLFYTTSREEGERAGLAYDGVGFNAIERPEHGESPDAIAVARYRDEGGIYLYTASHESPYQVGVFYFGSFSPSAKEIIKGTERVYGRKDDWWGGVEDFYGHQPGIGENHRGWSGEWPELKPAIGYYDQTQVETLEQHINQGADAGLAFFSFYWYWSNAKRGELLPEALTSFLHARNVNRLKFNLTLYAHPWNDDLAVEPANFEEVASKLAAYFAHPQYLRLPDGRPVFSVGDDRNVRAVNGQKCADAQCNEQALSAFLDVLKRRSVQQIGVAPFVQVQVGVPAWDRQPGIDGITCLSPPLKIEGGTTYPDFTLQTFAPLVGPRKPVSPCMLENFDERPRQDVLIGDRKAIRYLVGKTDALFRHNLEITKELADQNFQATRSPASRIIYLYAWNEWHEGGIIEPNANTDARDLNIVTDVFQLPRSPSLCLDRGECKLRR